MEVNLCTYVREISIRLSSKRVKLNRCGNWFQERIMYLLGTLTDKNVSSNDKLHKFVYEKHRRAYKITSQSVIFFLLISFTPGRRPYRYVHIESSLIRFRS